MSKSEFKLIIFTDSFPYTYYDFFEPELPYLDPLFTSIIIIPKRVKGKKIDVLPHIVVNTSFLETMKIHRIFNITIKTLFLVFTSFDFYKEIIKKPKQTLHIDSFIRTILYFGYAIRTKKWILDFIDRNNIDLAKTIFYTYWLDEVAMGVCLAKKKYPDIKIISRAHGYDMYNERSTYCYIPYRPEIFENLNKVYTASLDGEQYLSNKYPLYKSIFKVSKLGVKNPGFMTKQSEDTVFRIISCSDIVPVKRIELLVLGLKELGDFKKDHQFSWVHIGEGLLETKIKKLSKTILPKNIEYRFLGLIPNADVISFYKNNPVDIFINVSESEGGNPISIMEAQSCGIPVIACAVGGNKEIINEKVGILLNANPTPEEIAKEIIKFMENPEVVNEKKYNSIKNFKENYDLEKNFKSFAKELLNLSMELNKGDSLATKSRDW